MDDRPRDEQGRPLVTRDGVRMQYPPPGWSYADRDPNSAGVMMWCCVCGYDCKAEDLSWSQECPVCAAWWIDNPPPTEEEIGPLARIEPLPNGEPW